MRVFLSILFLLVVATVFVSFSGGSGQNVPVAGQFDRYFPTPAAAVNVTASLLKEKKWSELATYYDLTGTFLDRQDLASEKFFIDSEMTEGVSLEEFERYKQPFAPGFRFQSARHLGNDIIEVTVITETVNDDDTVTQGIDTFQLKAHPEGYQLIPKSE